MHIEMRSANKVDILLVLVCVLSSVVKIMSN